jgi:hypothetical protein
MLRISSVFVILSLFLCNCALAQYYSWSLYSAADCSGNPYKVVVVNDTRASAKVKNLGTCSDGVKYQTLTANDLNNPPNINRPSAIATFYLSPPCNSSGSSGIYGYFVMWSNTNGADSGASVFTCRGDNGTSGFTETKPSGSSDTPRVTNGLCQLNSENPDLTYAIFPETQLYAVTRCELSLNSGFFFSFDTIAFVVVALLGYFISQV